MTEKNRRVLVARAASRFYHLRFSRKGRFEQGPRTHMQRGRACASTNVESQTLALSKIELTRLVVALVLLLLRLSQSVPITEMMNVKLLTLVFRHAVSFQCWCAKPGADRHLVESSHHHRRFPPAARSTRIVTRPFAAASRKLLLISPSTPRTLLKRGSELEPL